MKSFKEALDELRNSNIFKRWYKDNKKCYLSYGFVIVKGDDLWRIGYFHPDNEKVTSFVIAENILIEPEEGSFKKPDSKVKELKPNEIKVRYAAALETAEKLQKEKYPQEIPLKIVLLVQNHNKLGNIWNITYVTQSFKTLNIKVDAVKGKIVRDELIELFEFKK
jgi:hypothetical protein